MVQVVATISGIRASIDNNHSAVGSQAGVRVGPAYGRTANNSLAMRTISG